MKIFSFINLSALSILAAVSLASPVTGRCQIYTLSTPISGGMSMSVRDLNGPTGSSGGFNFTFSNLTETIYLDPIGETIRQVGVILGSPIAMNISIQETQSIPGQFPNPPTIVSGSVTVTLDRNSGSLLFDTGTRPLAWYPPTGSYYSDGRVDNLNNLQGTYSLVTGGQTYNGSFTYGLIYDIPAHTFRTVSTTGYPDSLALGDLFESSGYYGYQSSVADVVASNGFHMILSVGVPEYSGYANGFEHFTWSLPGPITAYLVPATNSPTITTQPQSVIDHAHDTATFTVTASGTIPLSYQWSLNGTNISGGTLSSLTISNVEQHDLGTYVVVVTNGLGSVTSSNALLSMYPFIATPFAGAITYWGKDATLSLAAWGTGPLSYQWVKDGVAVPNATNQSLSLTNIQFTNAGLYSVVVTSSLGSATNAPAQVIVNPAGVSLGFSPTLTISGVAGYSYIIQSSTNLANTNSWVTLTNLTLTQPVQLFIDTGVNASSPFNSRNFYQILPGQ